MKEILMLVKFAERRLELNSADEIYCSNLIAEETGESAPLSVSTPVECESYSSDSPEELLKRIFKKAVENGKCGEGEYEEFSCRIMDILTPRPSEVRAGFYKRYKQNKRNAFEYYHALSVSSCYIKKEAVSRNIKWISDNTEKPLEITINLSKPEKNNIETAARLKAPASYPKCAICAENEGYTGNGTFRRNLRIVPVKLNGEDWFIQFSPYAYFDEHLIAVNREHTPMKISGDTILKLLDFTDFAPFYFIGCNACLPIVGGSILAHDHFQGGLHEMPLFKCGGKLRVFPPDFEGEAYIADWYNSVIVLKGADKKNTAAAANGIIRQWNVYSDESLGIIAETDARHNAVTPIARKEGGGYTVYLILRNNRTDSSFPEGIFHAHREYHNIKSEAIGLIEAMGLFILPPRLKRQLNTVKNFLTGEERLLSSLSGEDSIQKDFIVKLLSEYGASNTPKEAENIIKNEVSAVCENILRNTAVFKDDEKGREGFVRFLKKGRLL